MLSLQQLRFLLYIGLDLIPGLGYFHMPWVQPKKKRKKRKEMEPNRLVLQVISYCVDDNSNILPLLTVLEFLKLSNMLF